MEPENIEFNGVEYETKTLIQFSSLVRLLFDLAKRQKELESKYEYINENISDKEQRVSDLEQKVLGESKTFQKKVDNDNDTFSKKSKISNLNNDLIKKKSSMENSNSNSNIIINSNRTNTNNEEKSGINDDILDSINANKINSDLIIKLSKKVKDIEKKLNELFLKTNNDISTKIRTNKDSITNTNNHLNQLDNNYEEMNKKLIKFTEDFDKIKVKVEDFNIYDIFKGDGGEGGSVDATKALIMNLENKIFKKFSLYDEKSKKNESDLFKILEDMKNIKALIDNLKIQNQRNSENIDGFEKNLNEYINKNDNKIEDLTNSIESLEKKVSKGLDVNEVINDIQKQIKNLEEKIKNDVSNLINNNKQTGNIETENVIKNKLEILEKSIKEIKKNASDLEKILNQNIKSIDSSLREKISLIEKELQKKSNITDLNSINDKIYGIEEFSKELNSQMDTLQQYNEKFKAEMSNYNKKLEYLNAIFLEFKNDKDNLKSNRNKDFDDNNFIDQTTFTEYKNENNKKLEKQRLNIDELARNLSDISSSLVRYASNKEFIQFQNTLMSLLEEFKLNCFKKFMEKHEITKNLRILENQIKILADSCKKTDTSDNWLIAKKPLNNYQCASCEAMLKDLEQKDNFVAWNKYPYREEKTYRMGHGFSRMLQMVNEEIIKNIESKEGKGYASDEDKRYNITQNNRSKYNESTSNQENKSIKLPKVNQKNTSGDKYGLTVNKFRTNSNLYDDVESGSPDEPRISKIYKINNQGKKLFNMNKSGTDAQNNLSINNVDKNSKKIKEVNIKNEFLQMSMTQPNEKK